MENLLLLTREGTMKTIDYERGLARMAWTLGVLGGIGLFLYLLPYLRLPPRLFFAIISPLFIILILLSSIALNPAGKVFIFLLGITMVFLIVRFFVKGFRSLDFAEQQEASKRKISRRIVISALVIFGSVGYLGYNWYWQTHTGSRSGQVIDAFTGKPIEGAVVKYTWRTFGFLEGAIGGGGAPVSYETLTDKEGKYYIPNQRIRRESFLETAIKPEEVIIYKDGYAVYLADLNLLESPVRKPLGYPNDNQVYSKKNNVAKLYPWKEGESHERHVQWINDISFSSGIGELLKKEMEPERNRVKHELATKRR
jgi:hypothetical protein